MSRNNNPLLETNTVGFSVRETKNYDLFQFSKTNREISKGHVRKIKKSMESRGFIPHQHITVDPNGVIIDGQHRFEAAKDLGLSIYYSVYTENYSDELVRSLNITSKNWGLEDYVHNFCQKGYEDYHKYQDFVKRYEFPYGVPAYMLGMSLPDVKKGSLEWPIDDSKIHGAAEVVVSVRKHSPSNSLPHKKQFIIAVMEIMNQEKVDSEELARKAGEAAEANRVSMRDSKDLFLRDLVKAWNYNRRKNKIEFGLR